MMPTGGAQYKHRPCPQCAGKGRISDEEIARRTREESAHDARRHNSFAWIMLVACLASVAAAAFLPGHTIVRVVAIVAAFGFLYLFAANL
jgi:hypothetical protein